MRNFARRKEKTKKKKERKKTKCKQLEEKHRNISIRVYNTLTDMDKARTCATVAHDSSLDETPDINLH